MGSGARHSVSVSAVIVDESGDALVVKRRDNGRWEPPGGVMELDETILDALHREVFEETGLQIAVGPLTGVYKNMPQGIVALVFRCQRRNGTLLINDEVAEFRWMPGDQVSRELDESYAIRILDALDAGNPRVRTHDGQHLIGVTEELPAQSGDSQRGSPSMG